MEEFSKIAESVSKSFGASQTKMASAFKPVEQQTKKVSKSLEQVYGDYKDLGKDVKFSGNTAALQKQLDRYTNLLEKAKLRELELGSAGNTSGQMYEYAIRDILKYSNLIEGIQGQLKALSTENSAQKIDITINGAEQSFQSLEELKNNLKEMQGLISEGYKGGILENLQIELEDVKTRFPEATSLIREYEETIKAAGEVSGRSSRNMRQVAESLSMIGNRGLDFTITGMEESTQSLEELKNDLGEMEQLLSQGYRGGILSNLKTDLEDVKTRFPQATDVIGRYEAAIQKAGQASGFQNIQRELRGAEASTEQASNSARRFGDVIRESVRGSLLESILDDFKGIGAAVSEAQPRISALGNTLKGLKIPSIFDGEMAVMAQRTAEGIRQSFSDLANGNLLGAASDGIRDYVKQAQIAAGIKVYTEDYERIRSDIERTEQSLEKYEQKKKDMEASGVSPESKEWEKVAAQIAAAERQLDIYKGKKNLMEYRGQDMQFSGGLANQSAIKSAGATASAALSSISEGARGIWASISQAVGRIPVIGRVAKEAGYLGQVAFSGLGSAIAKIPPISQKVLGSLSKIPSTLKKLGSTAFGFISKISSAMLKVGSAAKGTMSKISAFGKSLSSADKSSKKMDASLAGGFKTILKYAFGIRSLYMLIGKFRSAAGEGFKNLAQYSNETNSSLSALMSSLTQLKNSFAAAFSPILNFVTPALNTLIQALSRAMNVVGQFFSALTGKSYAVQAVKVNQDYAKSLSGTGDSAKETEKKVEDLGEALSVLGFDELNQLSEPAKSADIGGIEDISDKQEELTPQDMFETVPIESKIADFAERIRNAWKNADFTGIGSELGTKLKNSLDNIPWEGIQSAAAKVGKSLATLINGFVEVPGLADSIGRTIAEAINTGLIGLNEFAGNLHWDSVGKFISDGINGMLENIDWDTALSLASNLGTGLASMLNNIFTPEMMANVGHTLAMGVNTVFTAVNDFAREFQWGEVGNAVAVGIRTALDDLDWETITSAASNIGSGLASLLNNLLTPEVFTSLGNTLSMGINTAFTAVNEFAKEFQWGEVGNAVGTGINTALQGIDWETIRSSATNIGSGIANFLNEAMNTTDWGLVGQSFGQGINTIIDLGHSFVTTFDWIGFGGIFSESLNGALKTIDFAKAGEFFSEGVKGLLNSLITFVENTDWKLFGGKVKEFLVNIDWTGIFERLSEVIGAAFGGLGAFLSGLFGDAIKNLSKWWNTVAFDENGKFTMAGLLKGIGESLKNIGTWIKEHIFSPFIAGFKKAFGIHSPSTVMEEQGGYIMDGLINGISNLIGSVVDKFDEIKGKIVEAWNTVKDKTVEIWGSISDKVSGTWEDIKGWASEKFEAVAGSVKTAWGSIKAETTSSWKSISDEVSGKWGDMKGWASEKFEAVAGSVKTAWGAIKADTSEVWGNVSSKAGDTWKDLKTWADEKFPAIKNSVSTAWNEIKTGTSSVWDGVSSTLGSTWDTVTGWASSKFDNIKSSIGGAWDSVQDKTKLVWNNIKDIVKAPINAIIGFINDFLRGIQVFQNNLASVLNSIHIDVPDWLQGLTGYSSFGFNLGYWTAPQIPYLAKGGLVTEPIFAHMGELSRPEAVLPLTDNRAMSMIAEKIYENAPRGNGSINHEILVSAFEEAIVRAMMNNAQNNKFPEYIQSDIRLNDDVMARAISKANYDRDFRMNPA